MNRWVYNIALLVGTACVAAGAGLLAGAGWALVALGGLVIANTLAGAWIATRSRG